MRETIITLMGFPLTFRYTIYEGGYIEWHLKGSNWDFTELLLRIHYTAMIETELRKVWFEEEYTDNQIKSAQLSLGIEDGDEPVF
jgi:hypothetical protein